jgi:hypothetical protein
MSTTAYYRSHPEYQARQKANAKANAQKNSRYPEYRLVIQLRKDIHRLKDSYQARLAHAQYIEKRLCGLAGALVRAERAWERVRENSKKKEASA